MDNYRKNALRNLINRFGNPHRKKLEPLPPHERKKRFENNILVFVLKHKMFDIDGFNEFEKRFKAGKIPKKQIDAISSAMRREKNEQKKQYKKKT